MKSKIVAQSFARAGLMGNPSDGYSGKAIALSVRNFVAKATLTESADLVIAPATEDLQTTARSMAAMVERLENFGYYGGIRLVKASIHQFYLYCKNRYTIADRNFQIGYETNIPRSVGLAGSSAIITACLKGLTQFYDIEIDKDILATLALNTEKQLLGISAGLMDRVIQMREGVVFMDFSKESTRSLNGVDIGQYEALAASPCLENLYVAWANRAAEPTEVLHNRLRDRFESGDTDVVRAMKRFATLAEDARQAIHENDLKSLAESVDSNFNLRASICELPSLHKDMIRLAREAGCSAKFCGSGGAIIGTFPDEQTFQKLVAHLGTIGCEVLRPHIWAER